MATRHLLRTVLILLSLLSLLACAQEPPTPVANLSVGTDSVTLPFGSSTTFDVILKPLVEREALGSEPILFVHLLTGGGELKRTFDTPLETADWQVGVDLVQPIEVYQSLLGEALPEQTYRLTVGLYELDGERYALASGNALVGDEEYQVLDVVVPDGTQPIANLEYIGDWQVFENPGDTRFVTRRWLGDGGGFAVEPVTEPLLLTMRLNLMEDIPGSDLSGTGAPVVKIVGNCSPDAEASGDGSHTVVLTLTPPEEGERCEVNVEAESLWVDRVDGFRRTAYFELVTIDPAYEATGA